MEENRPKKETKKSQYANITSLLNYNTRPVKKKTKEEYNKLLIKRAMIKYLPILLFVIIFMAIFRDYLFYIPIYFDIPNKCYIEIKSDELLTPDIKKIKKSISLLKNEFPDIYQDLCNNINRIRSYQLISAIGLYKHDDEKVRQGEKVEIYVSPESSCAKNYMDVNVTAKVIAHEVCHAVDHKLGQPTSEEKCGAVGDKVLEKLTN